MDNRNYPNGKKSAEDIFCEKFEQSGYSYEQQRRGYNASSAARASQNKKSRAKRTALLIVLGIVLFSLWIIAAVSIFQMVLGDDASPSDTDAETSEGGGPDTDAETEEDDPPELGYAVVKMEEGAHRAGQLLLINAEHKFDISFDKQLKQSLVYVVDKKLESLIVDGGDRLTSDTVEALREMTDAFKAETGLSGYAFRDDYGYCTANQQAEWYASTLDKRGEQADSYEFRAGESEHETGRAFDLKVYEGNKLKFIRYADEKYLWIYDNCYKYGIIYRYPADKVKQTGVSIVATSIHSDHFLYVGKAAAAAMHANGWCYNEFHANVLNYTYEGEHLKVTGADGVKYEMYYCPAAESGATDVKVPKDAEYTISGNNMGGFIVTVTVK